jgi:hypothetical protein
MTLNGITNTAGSIDVYRGEAGTVGIDAIVPPSVGWKMFATIPTGSKLCMCQNNAGEMISIDAQVPASVATRMIAVATRHGVSIRR